MDMRVSLPREGESRMLYYNTLSSSTLDRSADHVRCTVICSGRRHGAEAPRGTRGLDRLDFGAPSTDLPGTRASLTPSASPTRAPPLAEESPSGGWSRTPGRSAGVGEGNRGEQRAHRLGAPGAQVPVTTSADIRASPRMKSARTRTWSMRLLMRFQRRYPRFHEGLPQGVEDAPAVASRAMRTMRPYAPMCPPAPRSVRLAPGALEVSRS